MSQRPIAAGDVLAGRYRVDRELGAGAMGVVYAAWHIELDHAVAVKVLSPPVGDVASATARFRREVRAAARIRSEHVARVLDVGSLENGLPYMVLELLEGNDLEAELMRRGPLPVPEAVGYILQAIEAIAEAHAAGIVHRDLKPANLFLAETADRCRIIKVLDFGISKSILGDSASGHVSLTHTGMIMGSPLYMSPEQMRSARDADSRADIWALGILLYQLLTATTPFRGESIPELCAVLFRDSPPPFSNFRADVPEGLERAVFTCLERDPENRFQNVSDLAQAIVEFAPPARIHAERAYRVLFPSSAPPLPRGSMAEQPRAPGQPSAVGLRQESGAAAQPGGSDTGRTARSATYPLQASTGLRPTGSNEGARVSSNGRETQAAWDSGRTTAGSRRRHVVGLGAIAAALAGLAAGAFWLVSGRSGYAPGPLESANVASEQLRETPAPNPLPELPAVAEPSPRTTPSPSVVKSSSGGAPSLAEPEGTGARPPGPTASTPRKWVQPRAARPSTTPANAGRNAPATRAEKGEPHTSESPELPYYGGRR